MLIREACYIYLGTSYGIHSLYFKWWKQNHTLPCLFLRLAQAFTETVTMWLCFQSFTFYIKKIDVCSSMLGWGQQQSSHMSKIKDAFKIWECPPKTCKACGQEWGVIITIIAAPNMARTLRLLFYCISDAYTQGKSYLLKINWITHPMWPK